MARYILVDNLSERVAADVRANDPMSAYRMAPDPLEDGEVPSAIEGEDIYRVWYGYRIYEVPDDLPMERPEAGADPWEAWERLSEGMATVACIGLVDHGGE